jgi:hypothetical protein
MQLSLLMPIPVIITPQRKEGLGTGRLEKNNGIGYDAIESEIIKKF